MKKVQSLIGVFDLDPNRVLDIILDRFENCYENQGDLSVLILANQVTEIFI